METGPAYTPLEQSAFWRDMEASVAEYGGLYPTRVHYLEQQFLSIGNGMRWQGGRLVPEEELAEGQRDAPMFSPPLNAATKEPALQYMFDFIPMIPRADFLKFEKGAARSSGICNALSGFSKAARMPGDIDVHHLSAAMLMLKYIWLTPECLPPNGGLRQLEKARIALNTGFEIITQRKLEEDFARSCDELRENMPRLGAYAEGYVRSRREMESLKHASPKELLEMLDIFARRRKIPGMI